MCFVFIWEQTVTCATYSINWLVFITEMKSVYSAVRTRYFHDHHQELNCSSSLCFYRWSVVVAALLPPRSNGKTRGCYCSWAPDDGREDARNMLSCTYTSSNKLEKLLHLVGWFIWNVRWRTDWQTLNFVHMFLHYINIWTLKTFLKAANI
jgi:hypothetical protein